MDFSSRWYKAGASIIAAGVAARYIAKWKRGRTLTQRTQDEGRLVNVSKYYIGLDLANPTLDKKDKKASNVAVLDPQLACRFSEWQYNERGEGIIPESALGHSFILSIDRPQGLTGQKGSDSRQSELDIKRDVGIGMPCRTSYELLPSDAPFAGLVNASVKLFYQLVTTSGRFRLLGMNGTEPHSANLIEVYPGAAWRVLAGTEKLPRKDTLKGREARRELLEAQGVSFSTRKPPNTDQLDAAIASWTAYCFDINEITEQGIAPVLDELNSVVREGFIIQPKLFEEKLFRT